MALERVPADIRAQGGVARMADPDEITEIQEAVSIPVMAKCRIGHFGADGVFVGSGIFKSGDPDLRAKAIVEATTHFNDPKILADVSAGLGEPMVGISASSLAEDERLEVRGW